MKQVSANKIKGFAKAAGASAKRGSGRKIRFAAGAAAAGLEAAAAFRAKKGGK